MALHLSQSKHAVLYSYFTILDYHESMWYMLMRMKKGYRLHAILLW